MKRYGAGAVALLLFAIVTGSVPLAAYQAEIHDVAEAAGELPAGWSHTVYVNGVKVSGTHPVIRHGIAYLPANALAQALGVSIRWDAHLNVIKIDDRFVDVRPLNENGTLLLPVESVVQALNGSVEWDGRNGIIRISTVPSAAATVSGYPPRRDDSTSLPPIGPIAAPPNMSLGRDLPPPRTENPPPLQATTPYGSGTVYVPKTAQNNVFAVTVTNIEAVSSIKEYYHPRGGHRFVIVYLSQQNVSNEVQTYTGRFSILDENNRSFDYLEGLSNFWLVILRPYGINFGYLVFELPLESHPTRLELSTLNQSPLTINL